MFLAAGRDGHLVNEPPFPLKRPILVQGDGSNLKLVGLRFASLDPEQFGLDLHATCMPMMCHSLCKEPQLMDSAPETETSPIPDCIFGIGPQKLQTSTLILYHVPSFFPFFCLCFLSPWELTVRLNVMLLLIIFCRTAIHQVERLRETIHNLKTKQHNSDLD